MTFRAQEKKLGNDSDNGFSIVMFWVIIGSLSSDPESHCRVIETTFYCFVIPRLATRTWKPREHGAMVCSLIVCAPSNTAFKANAIRELWFLTCNKPRASELHFQDHTNDNAGMQQHTGVTLVLALVGRCVYLGQTSYVLGHCAVASSGEFCNCSSSPRQEAVGVGSALMRGCSVGSNHSNEARRGAGKPASLSCLSLSQHHIRSADHPSHPHTHTSTLGTKL